MSVHDDLLRYTEAAKRAHFAAQNDLSFDFQAASAALPRPLPATHGLLATMLCYAIKECFAAMNCDGERAVTAQLCCALENLSAALLRIVYPQTYFTDPER